MEPQMPCGGAVTSTIHASLGAGVMVSTSPCESDTETVSFVLRTLTTSNPVAGTVATDRACSCSRLVIDASADLTAVACETGLCPDPHPANKTPVATASPALLIPLSSSVHPGASAVESRQHQAQPQRRRRRR